MQVRPDWTHVDDHDNPDAIWFEYTVAGGDYPHELDPFSGDERHRLNRFGSVWKKGPPPCESET